MNNQEKLARIKEIFDSWREGGVTATDSMYRLGYVIRDTPKLTKEDTAWGNRKADESVSETAVEGVGGQYRQSK